MRTPNQLRKPRGRLTDKQDAFCTEYLKDLNASAAARRAGFSARSASRLAIALLQKRHVLARIEELQAERNQRVEIDSDWVLRRLQAELEADASDLFADDGTLKPVAQWPQIWRRGMVTALRVTQLYEKDGTGKNIEIGVVKDVQFADRTRKIELLGKHVAIGAFKERVALGTDDPLKKLFEQIQGQSIRPGSEIQTIEHQHEGQNEGDA